MSKFTPSVEPPDQRLFMVTPRAAELTLEVNQLLRRGYSPVGSAIPSLAIPVVNSVETPSASLSPILLFTVVKTFSPKRQGLFREHLRLTLFPLVFSKYPLVSNQFLWSGQYID